MGKIYKSEAKAMARVMFLRKHGIWPAYFQRGETWRLTYDPDIWDMM